MDGRLPLPIRAKAFLGVISEQHHRRPWPDHKSLSKRLTKPLASPPRKANAAGLRCTKQVVNMLSDLRPSRTRELEVEKGIIRHETRLIVDKCFELGNGDICSGLCAGASRQVW